MLKIDRINQSFSLLDTPTLADVSITERYDLQEFICNSPDAFFKELGLELFLLSKEVQASKNVQDRIDILAVDKEGCCVVIELKRGNHKLQMLQAISYAGMISQWESEDFLQLLNDQQQEALSEFLEVDRDAINRQQRIILIAEGYDYALLIATEWLSEHYGGVRRHTIALVGRIQQLGAGLVRIGAALGAQQVDGWIVPGSNALWPTAVLSMWLEHSPLVQWTSPRPLSLCVLCVCFLTQSARRRRGPQRQFYAIV